MSLTHMSWSTLSMTIVCIALYLSVSVVNVKPVQGFHAMPFVTKRSSILSKVLFATQKDANVFFINSTITETVPQEEESLSSTSTTIIEETEKDESYQYLKLHTMKYFPNAKISSIELLQHKPMGLTVEESLATDAEDVKHVFVSKIVNDGNAHQFGIRLGDVIVGVTGSFDSVVDVIGSDLDKIRSLIAARSKEEPLTVVIARGTDVMEKHESALVDLCILSETSDKDMQQCINVLFQPGYDDINNNNDDEDTIDCSDADTECMLDALFTEWDKDNDEYKPDADNDVNTDLTQPKKEIKPWSSRSSPSGTFVRNPRTGKMENIDE
mmetsp:Transcript_10709/g.15109  ORF Transcript_10709/g.15109 Transcript_10709/m.15109 type:complete len:326 (-) Transcript_10709:892-1869(-)